MRLVIVTGMSGAGKTVALKALEDMGFCCVDNLPIPLVKKFAQLLLGIHENPGDTALGIDIRSGEELSALEKILEEWKKKSVFCEILFLDAGDETLIKRYKETRRAHPLSRGGRVDKGIEKERQKLNFLRTRADYIIDTSKLLVKDLRLELEKIFLKNGGFNNLFVTVLSFGFKYGVPTDADLVFDVRFLPNPFYREDLKRKTGEEDDVRTYVLQGGAAEVFLEKIYDLLEFLIPNYVREGKNQLVIGIGCTGGKHRSVAIAGMLYEKLKSHGELGLKIEHRDMNRDLGN